MNKKNTKRVQLKGVHGKVCNLFFPPCTTKHDVQVFKTVAQRLVQSRLANLPLLPQDITYVNSHGKAVRNKLHKLGVSLDQQQEHADDCLLSHFLSRFTAAKSGETERKLIATARRMERFFGANLALKDITKTDALRFQKWLIEKERLAKESTARRTIQYACQIMEAALEDGLIAKNHFKGKDFPKTVLTDPKRHHYIDQAQTLRLWNALQDDEDRLRFVLLRYLGLRAPSELNALVWTDVDWDNLQITIHSPKTRQNKNGAIRTCPINHPDVLPTLRKAYEGRDSDKSSLVRCISGPSLRRRALRWLGRAGLSRWPQLFVNFRRSAVTDACDILPSHVVAAFFGHSEAISTTHYRMLNALHAKAFASARSMLEGA